MWITSIWTKTSFSHKKDGYYWPTMVKDCIYYARKCDACQFHANFIHQPPEVLHPTIASWPFDAWGLDIVGPLPKSSGGHLYILAATNYFSKWAEAVALKEVKKENVAIIRVNIIYRFGIPRYIITDNGKPFDNKLMNKICDLFDFKQRKSSMYHAALMVLLKHSIRLYATYSRKLSPNPNGIGMKEWKKLCGHIGQYIAHQLKQHHIHLLLELKQACHSSVKYPP